MDESFKLAVQSQEAAACLADVELLAALGDQEAVDEAVENQHRHTAHQEETQVDPLKGVVEVDVDCVFVLSALAFIEDTATSALQSQSRLADVVWCRGYQSGVHWPRH